MKSLMYIVLLGVAACNSNQLPVNNPVVFQVNKSDALLRMQNGIWYYNQTAFTGNIIEFYAIGNLKSKTACLNGKEHGYMESWYPNGKPEEQRMYIHGKKTATHTGWWPNGQKRFERHFENDQYTGVNKEWYESGRLYTVMGYLNNNEIGGAGWRDNGKCFMNFRIQDGVRYGLVNAELCYSLKKEKILNTLK